MNTPKILIIALMAILLIVSSAMAQPDPQKSSQAKKGLRFEINDPTGRNAITFKSYAPLEDIVGTTNEITGYLIFDPNNPKNNGYGELTVPVASLNTGIPLRDEHLRSEGWLNAIKYPEIKLVIKEIKDIKEVKTTEETATYDINVAGDFSLHGKTRPIEISGRITYLKENEATQKRLPGDLLAARADFEISLADYGVTGPAGMDIIGSKVGEIISIEVSIMGNSVSKTTQ